MLLERRQEERERLIGEARAYAERLRAKLGESRVLLYGSVARGDFNVASDIDLLVVSAALPRDPLERFKLLQSFALGLEEPKGLLPDEYARLEKGGSWATSRGARALRGAARAGVWTSCSGSRFTLEAAPAPES